MKTMMKLVLAMAIVAMAHSVSAASLIWRNGAGSFTDASAGSLANCQIILLVGAKDSAIPTITISGGVLTVAPGYNLLGSMALSATSTVPTTTLTITGTWTTGSINVLNPPAGFPSTVATTGFGTTNQRDYYMVVLDTSALATATEYAVTELAAKSPTTDAGSLTLSFAGTQLNTWTAVPEPTSMALLGLGVAALGLRRKFRK